MIRTPTEIHYAQQRAESRDEPTKHIVWYLNGDENVSLTAHCPHASRTGGSPGTQRTVNLLKDMILERTSLITEMGWTTWTPSNEHPDIHLIIDNPDQIIPIDPQGFAEIAHHGPRIGIHIPALQENVPV